MAISQDGPGLKIRDPGLFGHGVAPPEEADVAVQKGAVGHIPLVGPSEEIGFPASR
jgi:hypothetical protein